MTDAERKLWQGLRGRQMDGCKFRRQFPLGPYIVDFVCLETKLVIEVDGSQHLECADDRKRDVWLERQGFNVLRFWNHEVLEQTAHVLERVWEALHPHPNPPPSRGREQEDQAPEGISPCPLTGEGRDGGDGQRNKPSATQ